MLQSWHFSYACSLRSCARACLLKLRKDRHLIDRNCSFATRFVNYLTTPVRQHRRDGLKHLGPIIAARRKEREEKGHDYPEKPVGYVF